MRTRRSARNQDRLYSAIGRELATASGPKRAPMAIKVCGTCVHYPNTGRSTGWCKVHKGNVDCRVMRPCWSEKK